MKKNLFPRAFTALLALMACMACSVTLETDLQRESAITTTRRSFVKTMTITASLEMPDDETKTALSSNTVVWKTGDQIKVFNATHPSGEVFTLDPACDGLSNGTFSGGVIDGEGPFYAVYPASAAGTLTGSNISVTVPQTQVLTADSFGAGANLSIAKVNSMGDNFSFKNAMGALKLNLSGSITATRVRIQTKAAEPLWGNGTLTTDGDTPTLSLSAGTMDNRIVQAEGSATGTGFYVMVPAGTLASGFIAQVAASDGYSMVKQTSANNTIARSQIKAMPNLTYSPVIKSSFLDISALPFGYYSGIQNGGSPATLFAFAKATSQYASKVVVDMDRTFRIQDFSTGKYYSFVLPYTLALGNNYSATIESVVGSTYTAPADAGTFMLIQQTANAGWFVKSDDYSQGFIFLLED